MGLLIKLIVSLTVVFVAFVAYKVRSLGDAPPLPKIEDTWWGPADRSTIEHEIRPFKINVPDQVLTDLKRRLENTRDLIPPLEGIQHQYGLNTNLLQEILQYWKTKYNWREREKFLNKYPQFQVNIQGLNIHFLHVKPEIKPGVRVLPLLLAHGWPGSVREFYEIIPILTTVQKGRDYVFEVIAPSLPGYGFSESPKRPGFGGLETAIVFNNLMKRLGHQKYYVQGGDWGSLIVSHMATIFPEHIMGIHSNFCMVSSSLANLLLMIGSVFPSFIVKEEEQSKTYPLLSKYMFIMEESGYMHIQATKPDTVGVALNDSPAGLAAYITEKFITWTDPEFKQLPDGALKRKFGYDKLLDNIMIYWISGSITTSMRFYSENTLKKGAELGLSEIPTNVPSACARFSHELFYSPEIVLRLKFKNLVHISDLDGGHFAALEVPELLAKDIYEATDKFLKFQRK